MGWKAMVIGFGKDRPSRQASQVFMLLTNADAHGHKPIRVSSRFLCRVKRFIGKLHKHVIRQRSPAPHGPHSHMYMGTVRSWENGHMELFPHCMHKCPRLVLAANAIAQHHELVATDTRSECAISHQALQATPYFSENGVARRVSM